MSRKNKEIYTALPKMVKEYRDTKISMEKQWKAKGIDKEYTYQDYVDALIKRYSK